MSPSDTLKDEITTKVFQAMYSSFVKGSEELPENGLACDFLDGVSQGLADFFGSSPKINSSFISDRPLDFPNKIFKLVGLDSSNSGFGSPLYQIKRQILREAEEYIRNSQQAKNAREQSEKDLKEKTLALVQEIVSKSKLELGFEILEHSTTFIGGLSGSLVLRVHSKKENENKKLGVLKATTSIEDFQAEKQGLTEVASCWIDEYCDPRFSEAQIEINGVTYFVLITALAFPPSPHTPEIPTLHDLISSDRNKGRAEKVLDALSKQFKVLCYKESSLESKSVTEFCQELLNRWPKLQDKLDDSDFWFPVGLPTRQERYFASNEGNFRNPISVFAEMDLIDQGNCQLWFSKQHGDLNARNVLLQKEEAETEKLALIDFEKTGISGGLLDPCYLSLFLLEASRPSNSALSIGLSKLHHSFVGTVCSKSGSSLDHESWQLGLECTKTLFGRIWAAAKTQDQINELTLQCHLTLSVVAMVRCFYEVKALHEGRKNNLAESTILARLFFQISASALKPYVDLDNSAAPVTNVTSDLPELIERI